MIDKRPVYIENVRAWHQFRRRLTCRIAGRRFTVPCAFIDPKSEVQRPGDEGTLVIPTWLAEMLRLK